GGNGREAACAWPGSGPAEQHDHVVVRSQGRVHVRAPSNGGQGNRPRRPPAGEPRATGVIGRPPGGAEESSPWPSGAALIGTNAANGPEIDLLVSAPI